MTIPSPLDAQSERTRFCRRQRLYAPWMILLAYAVCLLYRTYSHVVAAQTGVAASGWQGSHGLVHYVAGAIIGIACELMYFAPIGFVSVVVVCRWRQRGRFSVWLLALVTGNASTLLIQSPRLIAAWERATMVSLAPSLVGCLLGVWAGIAWHRGWRARLWFLPKVGVLAMLSVLGAGSIAWLSLEDAPMSFQGERIGSEEMQRVVTMIRHRGPQSLRDDQTCTLHLTGRDVTALLSHFLSLHTHERKMSVCLDRGRISVLVSLPVQLGRLGPRYLNVDVAGNVAVSNGTLRLSADRLGIGSITVPSWLLHGLGPYMVSLLNHDPRAHAVVQATREIAIEPGVIQVTYGAFTLPVLHRGRLLHSSSVNERVLTSTQVQVDHLLLLFAVDPAADCLPSFNLCLKTAFALARERSLQGDAVVENRAAILALGILLGHPQIESLLGDVVRRRGDEEAVWRTPDYIVIYGRSDWTRHFCVSAAITVLSDENISSVCGSIKEELDMEAGRSGFSFADLLADRAGAMLASQATKDEEAALVLQSRLIQGFPIEVVCPPADNLPEGISDVDLESRYGGIGGEKYQQIIEEIERRVAACALYEGRL